MIRFHEGYEWTKHLDYLASTVPSLWMTGFKANHIFNGYTASIPEHVLPYISADSNVWHISDAGYIYIPGNKTAKDEQDRLSRNTAAEEEEETRSSTAQQTQWVGKQVNVGLRESGDVAEHLGSLSVELQHSVEKLIPEVNGHALPAFFSSSSSEIRTMLDFIREDANVGSIVSKPRGFFSPERGKDLQGDEKEDYEIERLWSSMQSLDPDVEITDDGDR